jgi:hypothetical protein
VISKIIFSKKISKPVKTHSYYIVFLKIIFLPIKKVSCSKGTPNQWIPMFMFYLIPLFLDFTLETSIPPIDLDQDELVMEEENKDLAPPVKIMLNCSILMLTCQCIILMDGNCDCKMCSKLTIICLKSYYIWRTRTFRF